MPPPSSARVVPSSEPLGVRVFSAGGEEESRQLVSERRKRRDRGEGGRGGVWKEMNEGGKRERATSLSQTVEKVSRFVAETHKTNMSE